MSPESVSMEIRAAGSLLICRRWVRDGAAALALSSALLLGVSTSGEVLWAAESPTAPVNAGPGFVTADGDDNSAPGDSRALRLSSVEGTVQVVQDGQVIADPAYANLPLFEGTQVITGNDGRAEVELEDGGIIRLSPNTTVTFALLQQQGTGSGTEVVLNAGLGYFELQPSTKEHALRVNFGSAAFSATSFAVVRVNMDTPPGNVAVFTGNVHLDRGNAVQVDVHGGESLSLEASDAGRYELTETIQPDSWDAWNSDRDQFLNSQMADATPASGAMGDAPGSGLADLDANGSWYDVPGQGYVWSPYDAQIQGAGFDPYGYGNWVFYPRYGYVWVSGYSWGYAPFSCGLWNYYDGFGWGWGPGLGGCEPWWGFGGGGWGYRIGRGPGGYRPPRRPLPGPVHPRPGQPHGRVLQAVVPVDHRPAGTPALPVHGRFNGPVTIAGHTVEPLRPVAPRSTYEGASSGFVNRSQPVAGGYRGVTGTAGRPLGYNPGNSGAYRPSGSGSRPAPAPRAPAYSGGGGGGGHSAPAPASHGGGGGGGSSHK